MILSAAMPQKSTPARPQLRLLLHTINYSGSRTLLYVAWFLLLMGQHVVSRRLGSDMASSPFHDSPYITELVASSSTLPLLVASHGGTRTTDKSHNDPSVVIFYYNENCTPSKDAQCQDAANQYAAVAKTVAKETVAVEERGTRVHFYALSCSNHEESCPDLASIPTIRFFLHPKSDHNDSFLSLPVLGLQPHHILQQLDKTAAAADQLQSQLQIHRGLDWMLRQHFTTEPLSDAQRGLLRHFLHLVQHTTTTRSSGNPLFPLVLRELESNIAYISHSYDYRVALLDEYSVSSSTGNDDVCTDVRALFRAMQRGAKEKKYHYSKEHDDDKSPSEREVAYGVYQFVWYLGRRDASAGGMMACDRLRIDDNDESHQNSLLSGVDDPLVWKWWTAAVEDGRPASVMTQTNEGDCTGAECEKRRRRRRRTLANMSTHNGGIETEYPPPTVPVVVVGCSLILLLWRSIAVLSGGERLIQMTSRRTLQITPHYGVHKAE